MTMLAMVPQNASHSPSSLPVQAAPGQVTPPQRVNACAVAWRKLLHASQNRFLIAAMRVEACMWPTKIDNLTADCICGRDACTESCTQHCCNGVFVYQRQC